MYHKPLFLLAHQIGDVGFISYYNYVLINQWRPYSELKYQQEKQLKNMINFAYKEVPYYHKLFKNMNLDPTEIKNLEDLEKLPVLTKEIIRQNWHDFKPANLDKLKYYEQATGGSTGSPLKYRLDKSERFQGGAILYRGWGYGGYELGDKMVFLAGSSLDVGARSNLITKAHETVRNIRKLSSLDMGEKEMSSYVKIMNSFKPNFIRGYASSIYFFSKWIRDNDFFIHKPLAIFTTAEKLHHHMREMIEGVFDCEVYDGYGLNDGGVSAFECSEHSGLHIDVERSVLEIADENGCQLNEGIGKILATSLHNYAMPFIRYDTNDLGNLLPENDICSCGRNYKLLKDVIGRDREFLITPSGKLVHGAAFFNLVISEFDDINNIIEFQVIQEEMSSIHIKLVCKGDIDEKNINYIKKLIRTRSAGWDVNITLVDSLERTKSGKYNFIINNIAGDLCR